MAEKVCIIGSGPGGHSAALRAAKLGAEVTVVEEDQPGGVCVNWGCIPTKALITGSGLFRQIQQAGELGIDVQGEVRPDWEKMINKKDKVVETQKKAVRDLFSKGGIEFVQGRAGISEGKSLLVQDDKGEKTTLQWDKLIIATGSRAAELPGQPFDKEKIISSDRAVNIRELPSRALILGGGVIGCEYACMLSELGVEVLIVEALSRLLPFSGLDGEISKTLQREMKKRKIKFRTGCRVLDVQKKHHGIQARIQSLDGAGEPEYQEADMALVCIGRKPNVEGLGLENAGVESTQKGWIQVDDTFRTNVEDIYAIGDVLGPTHTMLAHAAAHEGEIAAENALGSEKGSGHKLVPAGIFTHPEVAYVGCSEYEASQMGWNVDTESMFYRELGKAQAASEIAGQIKIVFDKQSRELWGVNIIGARATELISEAALAIQTGRDIREIAGTIHPHPTFSEIIREVAQKAESG